MPSEENFLTSRKRNQPINLAQDFSDEEMARDWTLSEDDIQEVRKYRKDYRLFFSIQLCAIRLYGRFIGDIHDLSPRILNYLNQQLELPPSLSVQVPEREATYLKHRLRILNFLGFQKYDEAAQSKLENWLEQQAIQGQLPNELFHRAERFLLTHQIVLPGPSVIERLVVSVCASTHSKFFESIYKKLSPQLRQSIDRLLTVSEGEQRSLFYQLKEYPPSAKISSLKDYLQRYRSLSETGIDEFDIQMIDPEFLTYLFKLAKRYSSRDMKRFQEHKRYALMICFLLESRKVFLDHLVKMHEQYMMEISRETKNSYEKKHREFRKRQKKAIDIVLKTTTKLLKWPDDQPIYKNHSGMILGN